MQGSPERSLHAWAEYLRDMGLADLYRHTSLEAELPAATLHELRAALHQASTLPSAEKAAPASVPRSQAAAKAAEPAASGRPPLRSTPPASRSPTRPLPPAVATPPDAAPKYFQVDEDTRQLPPELAAPMPKPRPLDTLLPPPQATLPVEARAAALDRLRATIGDCTRCPLAYAGRHTIVFGEGDPSANLMFVGEGPGADEDQSGRPFVGKAGQLLGNMITAMGLQREQVYIANIVKCRPPGNRTPEFAEASTCSPFLLEQIDIVQPRVIVALGSTAATYLLGVRQPLAGLRGAWHRVRDAKLAVTYHPAFLLRDPRQKAEAWKDLQRVMKELGLTPAVKPS